MSSPLQPSPPRNYRGSGETDPIDRHLGARLRQLRIERGWSQGELGRRLGTTFQQVQKYESGRNRLSAARLWAAALAFEVELADFFAGYRAPRAPRTARPALETVE